MSEIINDLYLRRATWDDAEILLKWANDPQTRENSFSTNEIRYEEHYKWYKDMLESENHAQYLIVYNNESVEKAVGQIRIDISGSEAEISYSIAPECRGNGFGNKALELICEEVEMNYQQVNKLIGQVKPENKLSVKVFSKNGFREGFRQFERYINR